MSIIYYKPKQSSTSTYTNYFDLVFKERGAKPLVELDNYTAFTQLVNIPADLSFSYHPCRGKLLNPEEAAHYIRFRAYVNRLTNLFLSTALKDFDQEHLTIIDFCFKRLFLQSTLMHLANPNI